MASYLSEGDFFLLLAGELEIYRTKGSFHNAAGNAEDHAGTGVVAHDVLIPVFLGQTPEHDTASADHPRQLSGGKNCIHILETVHLLLFSFLLKLLRNAGHDGNHKDILGIHMILLCPPGLQDRALHLVRRLAAGQMGKQVPVIILGIVYPSR